MKRVRFCSDSSSWPPRVRSSSLRRVCDLVGVCETSFSCRIMFFASCFAVTMSTDSSSVFTAHFVLSLRKMRCSISFIHIRVSLISVRKLSGRMFFGACWRVMSCRECARSIKSNDLPQSSRNWLWMAAFVKLIELSDVTPRLPTQLAINPKNRTFPKHVKCVGWVELNRTNIFPSHRK